ALDVEGKPNSILMERFFQDAQRSGTRVGSGDVGVGIEEVNLDTLYHSLFLKPRAIAVGYVTDEEGDVRIMATINRDPQGYVKDDVEFAYMPKGGENFAELLPDLELEDFNVVGVDSAKNIAYALGEADGFTSLYSVALDGTGKTTVLLSQPGYDIDNVVRIGRKQRVVGATFATDRRHYEFFDPDFKKLVNGLSKALPGKPQVEVVDASTDEKRLLVMAHSDVNPGMMYLFDRATGQLSEIAPVRGELEKLQLSPMTLVRYTARDGTEIPAYLTLPPGSDKKGLPTIVMPHGGPEARDEWGFDWLAQYFAQRGYAVLQPNYRGSAGYGSAWEMDNGFQSWRTAIADVIDAGHWLVKEGIASEDKLAIFGWSYGGYAALQSAVIEPDLFKAVVAVAPVTDLGQLRDDARNYTSYPKISEFLGHGNEIIDEGSPARRAERITAPVMLVHGEYDEQASFKQSVIMADALKDAGKEARFLRFPVLDHSLRDSPARAQMLRETDEFLRESLGIK
ncbi:MAG: family peptidase, partial [Proteobacteria bacterium]|nr:family peptidase [Pseudomonadota bacterium]